MGTLVWQWDMMQCPAYVVLLGNNTICVILLHFTVSLILMSLAKQTAVILGITAIVIKGTIHTLICTSKRSYSLHFSCLACLGSLAKHVL